jgi:hypothetical protein
MASPTMEKGSPPPRGKNTGRGGQKTSALRCSRVAWVRTGLDRVVQHLGHAYLPVNRLIGDTELLRDVDALGRKTEIAS